MSDLEEIKEEIESLELKLLPEIWRLESLLHEIFKRIDARTHFDRNLKKIKTHDLS